MPLSKIKGSGVADITKEDEENNSLDTFIRQAIGKEPFLSFSRVNDSPVPWIQLLHALDQQDLPGWPLLSPLKIQMQKCEKCSREFCSTINYRRHLRLHRRNLNLDKDSTTKNRGLLQEFWDKLSVEKTMEIMSLEDVSLEGVTGNSVIKKLASFIRKPGFTSLPQSYIRAGSALLDIVQARPSKCPVSSQELFSILDDASEKTFLCAGTAESLQKYVFDGEAGKIGLEMRNSIACTSFLVEQKLVKACLADKDAEALRYQKLLVEEEEAAQKRQAAVLERKRQKKLRQKELKGKEQAIAETFYPEDRSPSPPSSSLVFTPESNLELSENPCSPFYIPEPAHIANLEGCCGEDHDTGYGDAVPSQNVEHKTYRSGRRHVNSRWQAPKLQKSANGYHTSHNYHVVKLGPMQKHVSFRDSRTQSAVHGGKVWTPKTKTETDEESYSNRLQVQADGSICQDKKSEVLIGSISVILRNQNGQKSYENLGRALETSASDHTVPTENGFREKPNKFEAAPGIVSRSTGKLWRPVSRVENGGQLLVRNCNDASEVNSVSCNDSAEGQQGCREENGCSTDEERSSSYVNDELERGLKFSSQAAEAFLAKRWKDAISSDHVTLVLFPEANPLPGCSEVQDYNQARVSLSSKMEQSGILSKAENTTPESSTILIPQIRPKLDKGSKVKYIPKQRSIT